MEMIGVNLKARVISDTSLNFDCDGKIVGLEFERICISTLLPKEVGSIILLNFYDTLIAMEMHIRGVVCDVDGEYVTMKLDHPLSKREIRRWIIQSS